MGICRGHCGGLPAGKPAGTRGCELRAAHSGDSGGQAPPAPGKSGKSGNPAPRKTRPPEKPPCERGPVLCRRRKPPEAARKRGPRAPGESPGLPPKAARVPRARARGYVGSGMPPEAGNRAHVQPRTDENASWSYINRISSNPSPSVSILQRIGSVDAVGPSDSSKGPREMPGFAPIPPKPNLWKRQIP